MPYYRKRNYLKKRGPMRRRRYNKKKLPFTKKQSRVIEKLAIKKVNLTRELKCRTPVVDEFQQTISGSNVITCSGTTNSYVLNSISQGDSRSQRTGTQISPHRLVMRGWAKINGSSADQSFNELKVRFIMAYVSDDKLVDIQTSLASTQIFWSQAGQIPTGDYRDIIRNLNYDVLSPIYDRVHTICPSAYTRDTGDGSSNTTRANGLKDYFNININRKFPTSQELRWNSTTNSWQKKNLVMFSFCRTMNDDTVITTNVLEYNLEGQYYYFDA